MCFTSTTLRRRLSEQLGVSLLCTDHTVCVSHPLQSDLVYPNNLVSLYSVLVITVCVSHPLQSDLVYPNNLVSLYSVLAILCVSHNPLHPGPRLSEQLGVSLLCTGHTVCVSHPLQSDLVYPNNLVSLYSVLVILCVSHIHYSQTSFIRTTWCLSTLY